MLETVVTQEVTPIPCGSQEETSAFDLSFNTTSKMKYVSFVKLAEDKDREIGELTIAQHEDMFWNNLIECSSQSSSFTPMYAIDNTYSLFPRSCEYWNLNNFSNNESLIHDLV